MVKHKEITGIVSPLSKTTIEFILSRNVDARSAKKALHAIDSVIEICDVFVQNAKSALNSKMKDFEDAVQYFSALQARQIALLPETLKIFQLQ